MYCNEKLVHTATEFLLATFKHRISILFEVIINPLLMDSLLSGFSGEKKFIQLLKRTASPLNAPKVMRIQNPSS